MRLDRRNLLKLAVTGVAASRGADGSAFGSATTIGSVASPASAGPTVAPGTRHFVTRHSGIFGGHRVDYTATVADLVITEPGGGPARFFTTAYLRKGEKDSVRRPVIFFVNGGPSVASELLHIGSMGPRRIAIPEVGRRLDDPHLIDNPYAVLDLADLVFLDPADTGFSRILRGGDKHWYFSTNGDALSLAHLSQAWLRANGRDHSPRYIFGESYGSIRAVLIAQEMAKTRPVDGLIVMGNAIGLFETNDRKNNIVSYAVSLPMLAVTAAYHGRADANGRSVQQIVDDAYEWGTTDYLEALAKLEALTPSEQRVIAERLQTMTGVSADYYLANDLVIKNEAFRIELLKDKSLRLARYDTRYVDKVPQGTKPGRMGDGERDAFSAIWDAIHKLQQRRLADELGVTIPVTAYRTWAPVKFDDWSWNGGDTPFVEYDWPSMLACEMSTNPIMRFLSMGGFYDTTSTVGMTQYLFNRTRLPKERSRMVHVVGGHMAYTEEASLKTICGEVRALLGAAR